MTTLKNARKPRAVFLPVYYLKMADGLKQGIPRSAIVTEMASRYGMSKPAIRRALASGFPPSRISAPADVCRLLWVKRGTLVTSHYDLSLAAKQRWARVSAGERAEINRRISAAWNLKTDGEKAEWSAHTRRAKSAYWATIPPAERSAMMAAKSRSMTPEQRRSWRANISLGLKNSWARPEAAIRRLERSQRLADFWAQFTPIERSELLSARFAGARASLHDSPSHLGRASALGILAGFERLPFIDMLSSEQIEARFQQLEPLISRAITHYSSYPDFPDIYSEACLGFLDAARKWDGRTPLAKLVMAGISAHLHGLELVRRRARTRHTTSLNDLGDIGYDEYGNLVKEPLFAEIYR